jgi:hypothetical protein
MLLFHSHNNHILLYKLKKRQIEERGKNDNIQDSELNESAYETTPDDEDLGTSNSTAEINAYAETFYEYASSVFEFAYNSSKESWTDVSNTTLYDNIADLMNTDILVDKVG